MAGIKKSRSKKMKKKASKMLDVIRDDMENPKRADELINKQPVDVDLPGLGQFYCIECDRYFISRDVLLSHKKSKLHKSRVRQLKEKPYTVEESVLAAGMGTKNLGLSSSEAVMR